MTLKQRIDKFVKKHTEPYQFKIQLNWERKDGYHSHAYFPSNYYACDTHYCYRHFECTVRSNPFIAAHYNYDEELELFEVAYAEFDCHTPKAGEDRRWKYLERYFIPKGEKIMYDINGNVPDDYRVRESRWVYDVKDQYTWAQRFTRNHYDVNQFRTNFISFVGDDRQCIRGYHVSNECYHWIFEYWLRCKHKERKSNKTQKTIDGLVEKKLECIDDLIQKHALNAQVYYRDKYAWFDIENRVFRCFQYDHDNIIEDKRVYILPKKFIVVTKNHKGEWVSNGSFGSSQFYYKIVNRDEVYKLPYCTYLESLLDERANVYQVVSIMRHNEIEQLVNMGMTNIAKRIIINAQYINSGMKEMLGEPNKKKSVCQKYGITKKQLAFFDDHVALIGGPFNRNIIVDMKTILGIQDLASLDYDSFVKYFNALKNLDRWKLRQIMSDKERVKHIFLKLSNMTQKHNDAIHIFCDTLNEYDRISMVNKPQTNPYNVKSYEELVRLHDTCVEIVRIETEERRRLWNMQEAERKKVLEKKMKKLDEERIKLNYDEDNFIIRLPENLAEIVNEGSSLHHCVGGYTNSHASGDTTILFLRRRTNPTVPFYTIEVCNGRVCQIHGFGNKWLGNDPDAIPTVVRWLRKHNIQCSAAILTCTAIGYGQTNSYVPMPVVD